jgi:hypothetical protein
MASSMMQSIASTAAGVAIGRGIDRALFGGGGGHGPEGVAGEEAPEYAPVSEFADEEVDAPESVCSREFAEFQKCMARSNNVSACDFNFQMLASCQAAQAPQTGFADAGRF